MADDFDDKACRADLLALAVQWEHMADLEDRRYALDAQRRREQGSALSYRLESEPVQRPGDLRIKSIMIR